MRGSSFLCVDDILRNILNAQEKYNVLIDILKQNNEIKINYEIIY